MASPSNNSNFELENVTLDEPKKPHFPLDVAEQTVLLATTREHFQVIQVLNIALLVVALMVPFVPLWCKYQGVHIGLNQMMLGQWVDLGDVTTLTCLLLNVNAEVCMSAATFYHAGITVMPRQFEVMWSLAMLLTLYNIANLHSRIHAKHWRWSEFEVRDMQFLHLVTPCLYFSAIALWWVISNCYSRQQLEYDMGIAVALLTGIGQSLLGLYYYRQRLNQDQAEMPNYFMVPSS